MFVVTRPGEGGENSRTLEFVTVVRSDAVPTSSEAGMYIGADVAVPELRR